MKRATVDLDSLLEGVLGPRPDRPLELERERPAEMPQDRPRRPSQPEPREPAPSELRRRRRAAKGSQRAARRKAHQKTRAEKRLELEAAGALPRTAPLPSRRSAAWWPYMLRRIVEDLQAARKEIDYKSATKEQLNTFYRARETLIRKADLNARSLLRALELET